MLVILPCCTSLDWSAATKIKNSLLLLLWSKLLNVWQSSSWVPLLDFFTDYDMIFFGSLCFDYFHWLWYDFSGPSALILFRSLFLNASMALICCHIQKVFQEKSECWLLQCLLPILTCWLVLKSFPQKKFTRKTNLLCTKR